MEDNYRTAFCIMQQERTSTNGSKFDIKKKKWVTPKRD